MKVEAKLADLCAENNYNKIKEEIAGIKCEEGGINSGKLWKLKKKLNNIRYSFYYPENQPYCISYSILQGQLTINS